MFLLISFVLANNYCVGNSLEDCKSKCQIFTDNFTDFFERIPTNEELNTTDDVIHDIYISFDVDYLDTKHNLIFCISSIRLIYYDPKTIKIKDHIYADSKKMPNDVSMLFNIGSLEQFLSIEVETEQENKIIPFTIECHREFYITTKFYTEYIPNDLITISNKYSYLIKITEITNNVKKLFKNHDELFTFSFTYYCLSDKKNKCENYSDHNLQFINSVHQVNCYPCFLIVETTKPQVLIVNPNKNYFSEKEYVHIIAMPGSDITYIPQESINEGDFYVILHSNSIEMYDMYYEGEGNFTLSVNANISLVATTKTNNNHFTLKTRNPFDKNQSYIYALRDDLNFNFDNKIYVSEYSLFHGPKCLSGLFEPEKFLSDDEFIVYNVTANTLKETDFQYVTYYFKEGDHEIPKTWKSSCRFEGINPYKTHFIFSDVYSFDGYKIDNFIDVNHDFISVGNRITIKPSHFFNLSAFNDVYLNKHLEKYRIIVENDFIMYGKGPNPSYDDVEISHNECKIIGNGTIKFLDYRFLNQVSKFCQIDENVSLEYNGYKPYVQICLGQSDKCKSEIEGFNSFQYWEWVWLKNIKTCSCIYLYTNTIYVTDRRIFLNDLYYIYQFELILTKNSVVTIAYYNDKLKVNKDGIDKIKSQSSSAKLIVLFQYSNMPYYSSSPSFHIYYNEDPTQINFQVYFHYEIAKLEMIYYKNYTVNSIQLTGKSVIYINEPYLKIINIFKYSNLINFYINPYNDYHQICFSDEPIEYNDLYDFVLCSNYEEFKQYDSKSLNQPSAYIYKDILLDFNSNEYHCKCFYFYNTNLKVSINLSNDTLFIFDINYFDIICNTHYSLYYDNDQIKFYFDIKDSITLDCIYVPSIRPTIEFISSLDSVEIFPSSTIAKLIHYFKIAVPKNYIIYSPVPKYLEGLFESIFINYSKNWAYYHLSDEGKQLYDSYSSILFDDFDKDDNLPENIVLAVGKNDNLTIPLNWEKVHNFYIFQGTNYKLLINRPLNLTYNLDGLVLNHKFNIVVGNLRINVPRKFTVNSYIPSSYIYHYFYSSDLNCSENPRTALYTGSMYTPSINGDGRYLVSIYGYGNQNYLTIYSKNPNEQYYLQQIMELYSNDNVKYRFYYDSICYCTSPDYNSKCSGKYFRINDTTTFFAATEDYPDLTIWVFNDINIPFLNDQHYVLDPKDENIKITVPDFPISIIIKAKETLQFIYSDSKVIEIINKSYVYVTLQGYLSIYIESNTNSLITFSLESDVYVSIESAIEPDFSISVEHNYNNFYSEDTNDFKNIFNGALVSYIRICAYDFNASSSCTYSRNKTLDEVFRDQFIYNAVEIALSSKPHEIMLPSISKPVMVNILPAPSSNLIMSTATNVQITPENIIVNKYWTFVGDRELIIIKIGLKSSLSVTKEMTVPIVLQLKNRKSYIDLIDFDEQNSPLITFVKTGNETNEIIVYGSEILYENFIKSIKSHDNITIIRNGTQKYLCICTNKEECGKCKEGVDGLVVLTNFVSSDPGEDVKIRVFSDYEVKSSIFNNEHDVFINPNCNLYLSYVNTVNQNIDEGLNVDCLHFVNGSNLILKPKNIDLNIIMREKEKGPYFTIEIDTFLRLNVVNAENRNIKSSRLHANGFGELNSYDYPFDRIQPSNTVKVIKGVYIICNSKEGKDVCSYESARKYRHLGNQDYFSHDFDPNSKILVFLDSFTSSLKVKTSILHNQEIKFVKAPSNSRRLLERQNKLIFESNSEILNTENSTELYGEEGGTSLDNDDSDLFVICFNESIKIKQEGNLSKNLKPLTIQPTNNQATIIIDDSVEIEKQKLKIESENDEHVSITLLTNKNLTNEEVDKYIILDKDKISINLGPTSIPTSLETEIPTLLETTISTIIPISLGSIPTIISKKGLKIGEIVGIVVGAVLIVAIITVVIVLFIVKNKRKENTYLNEDDLDFSDSTF